MLAARPPRQLALVCCWGGAPPGDIPADPVSFGLVALRGSHEVLSYLDEPADAAEATMLVNRIPHRLDRLPLLEAVRDAYDDTWTEKAYGLLLPGHIKAEVRGVDGVEVSVVTGPCPRCERDFTDDQVHTAMTERRTLGAGEVESAFKEIDLRCECGREHPDRPENGKGCGVAYRVPANVRTP